jgi:hypothetical protein
MWSPSQRIFTVKGHREKRAREEIMGLKSGFFSVKQAFSAKQAFRVCLHTVKIDPIEHMFIYPKFVWMPYY